MGAVNKPKTNKTKVNIYKRVKMYNPTHDDSLSNYYSLTLCRGI